MHEDSYGAVTARYYDAAYAALGTLGPDAAFYRGLAQEVGGPVLEIGCGTGRVLLEVAQTGRPCTGLDLSPSMLDVLKGRLPRATTALADMRDFDLDGRRFASGLLGVSGGPAPRERRGSAAPAWRAVRRTPLARAEPSPSTSSTRATCTGSRRRPMPEAPKTCASSRTVGVDRPIRARLERDLATPGA